VLPLWLATAAAGATGLAAPSGWPSTPALQSTSPPRRWAGWRQQGHTHPPHSSHPRRPSSRSRLSARRDRLPLAPPSQQPLPPTMPRRLLAAAPRLRDGHLLAARCRSAPALMPT
jgi:hypothetical protein